MIKYKLKCKSSYCSEKNDFDGWFQNIEAFEKQKKLFLAATNFYLRGVNYFYLICGLHIIKRQRDVKYGIWMKIIFMILQEWE